VLLFSCRRSLYIDWRMVVVVGGNVLPHEKRRGVVLAGELSCGKMSEGEMSYTRVSDVSNCHIATAHFGEKIN